MPHPSVPGRSIVTRGLRDIVRAAVLGSDGVTGYARRRRAGPPFRPFRRAAAGIRMRLDRGLDIEVSVSVAHGGPVAEVARQIDSAARYGVRHAFGRDVDRPVVHVDNHRVMPVALPPERELPRSDALDAVRDGAAGGTAPRTPVPLVGPRIRTASRRSTRGDGGPS